MKAGETLFKESQSKMVEQHITCPVKGIRQSLSGFANNTTFHGIRYIVSSSSIPQRLVWIVVILACTTGVVIQISDRIQYYYTWPNTVNVKLNYNHSLKFPATTICNQNVFKATAAARLGRYRLVEDMYSTSNAITLDDLHRHNAGNISLEEMYQSLAHDKHDFIVSCVWNKVKCSADDFVMTFTDHGVCYTFTGSDTPGSDTPDTDMNAHAAGVEFGLRLALNVEEYEYMAGPHDAAGVKILLHDPREMPAVHGLGQAIPTGTHAFVGVKLMIIENLPKPHGKCEYKYLRHTDLYTTEDCYLDCLMALTAERCGCRDIYMPHHNGYPPACTLEQTYNCLLPLKDMFNKRLRADCTCPVPCKFVQFEPTMSYATISNHLADKLITHNETTQLETRLRHASSIKAKMDATMLNRFQEFAFTLSDTLNDVKLAIDGMKKYLDIQENETKHIIEKMGNAYKTKRKLYMYQKYIVERNFMRGVEAMEERTFRNIVDAYAEFAMLVVRRIRRLIKIHESDVIKRDELYNLVIDSLTVRKEIVQLAKDNITVLFHSFTEGEPIFNYTFEDIDWSHNEYIIPKHLLNHSMHYSWYIRDYGHKLRYVDLKEVETSLDLLIDVADVAYENVTINDTRLNDVFERFLRSCRKFMYSKSVIYSHGIEQPAAILTKRYLEFDDIWEQFVTLTNSMNQTMTALRDRIHVTISEIIPTANNLCESTKQYLSSDDISLLELAELFSSNGPKTKVQVNAVFQEIDMRVQSISDTWPLIKLSTDRLWEHILSDEDMKAYYLFTNNTMFLQRAADLNHEWDIRMARITDADVSMVANHKRKVFVTAIKDISGYLDMYKSSMNVDADFLRQNFLKLDIFYRKLSYEHIEQQKAYDSFSLICDIGGAMGLFIGASMLTIMEVVDLILLQIPFFTRQRSTKKDVESNKIALPAST